MAILQPLPKTPPPETLPLVPLILGFVGTGCFLGGSGCQASSKMFDLCSSYWYMICSYEISPIYTWIHPKIGYAMVHGMIWRIWYASMWLFEYGK